MPKSTPQKLAYQKRYNARPEMVNRREKNNAARRQAIKEGRAHVGDGKDIGHKRPLDRGGSNAQSNLVVQSRRENRGWRRGQSGYRVGNA